MTNTLQQRMKKGGHYLGICNSQRSPRHGPRSQASTGQSISQIQTWVLKPGTLNVKEGDNYPHDDIPIVDSDWQTVNRKRSSNIVYNIPVSNKFEELCEENIKIVSGREKIELKCDSCDLKFSTNLMLRTHIKIHKMKPSSIDECNCATSIDYTDSLKEVRILRKDLENTRNEMKKLKEYYELKQGEKTTFIQDKAIKQNEGGRQSVITYRCTK